MKKIKTRKLEETSWLAQIVRDRISECIDRNNMLKAAHYSVLLSIIHEAEKTDVEDVYFDGRQIIICNLRSMNGCDRDYLICNLRGMQERYTDIDGMYLISVLTTHDLNSATIKDISELLFEMTQR